MSFTRNLLENGMTSFNCIRGGAGGNGLPKVGGIGGSGGSVIVEASDKVSTYNLYRKY